MEVRALNRKRWKHISDGHGLETMVQPRASKHKRLSGRLLMLAVVVQSSLVCFVPQSTMMAQIVSAQSREKTYCNPVNLAYRFRPDLPSRREAADPTMVVYKKEYWLFPSKSGGYWHSSDLLHWSFVEASGYPVENYAPTVMVYNGKLYLTAGGIPGLYVTDNPLSGQWTKAADFGRSYGDPALFLDDDGRVYMYSGVSGKDLLHVSELDPHNGFKMMNDKAIPSSRDPQERGWEVPGDRNDLGQKNSWIEGSWMNKHDGKYYLQYAAPGTQFQSYGDGVLTSSSPLGPFVYESYSPFSFKPTGFITGAGHSSTFAALDGQFWHVATMRISMRADFERRVGLFPAWFAADGTLVTDTYLGDYPHYVSGDRGLVGWMLLSRKKKVSASSSSPEHEPEKAVDEDVRTWWSAATGDPGEWLQIDLGGQETVQAVQINFADEGSKSLNRSAETYLYQLDSSDDGQKWKLLVDHSKKGEDAPHDYEVLTKPAKARYIRIRNAFSPNGAKFSLSDFRVFGNSGGVLPAQVLKFNAALDSADTRHAKIRWQAAEGAEFYIVRLGTTPQNLSQNYQVYDGQVELDVRSLNKNTNYFVTVDSVNENGVTRGTKTLDVAQGK